MEKTLERCILDTFRHTGEEAPRHAALLQQQFHDARLISPCEQQLHKPGVHPKYRGASSSSHPQVSRMTAAVSPGSLPCDTHQHSISRPHLQLPTKWQPALLPTVKMAPPSP
ncbi:hypothetical protein AV530_014674 [Patagioenas fasciata monilis]|uniref:Uncharacterized protein n=1 Tax=Patagioenas fasciata monilis TaxID=372326 RepID=A0A1V4KB91_PATFA|nr:hypothetical protein AV530_014674 [Patagioenas fasciata monilis]